MSYWYLAAPDGRHFCWAKEPSYVCPIADVLEMPDAEARERGEKPRILIPEATRAADTLLMDPLQFALLIRRAHHSHGAGRKRREDGSLSEDCAICGRRMTRLGFSGWVEADPGEEDVRSRIATRIGASPYQQVGPRRYFDRKKDAEAWAREEVATAKLVATDA